MDKHMESNALHQCREWGEFSWGRRGWDDKGYKSAAVNMIDYPWSAEEGFLDSKRTSIRTVCSVDFRVLGVYRCENWKHKVRRCSGKPGHKHVCRRGGPAVTGPRRTEPHGEMPTRELNLTEQKPERKVGWGVEGANMGCEWALLWDEWRQQNFWLVILPMSISFVFILGYRFRERILKHILPITLKGTVVTTSPCQRCSLY